MKKFFMVALFFLFSSALMALEFEYAYGYYSCFDAIQKNERGFEAIPTLDGGYAIVGYTTTLDGDRDVMLVKTNEKGDTLWTRSYGGDFDDEGRSIKQLSDGSYVILAMAKSFGAGNSANWWTIRVNGENGDMIWQHHTGNTGIDEPARVLVSPGDAIYVAGTYYGGAPESGGTYDGYLEKLNTGTGEMEWVESIHYGTHEYITNAALAANGDILLVGYMNDKETSNHRLTTLIVRVNSAGERVWIRKIPNAKKNLGYGITELPNGELIVVASIDLYWSGCETNPKGHFKRLTATGEEIRVADFNSCGEYIPRDVIAVSDDEFVVAGYGGRVGNGGSQTSILAKYDTTMTELWIRAYGGRDRWNGLYSVVQAEDGGFIAGGYLTMKDVGTSPKYDEQLSILKTDTNGKADQFYISKNPVAFGESYINSTVYDTIFYTNRGFYPLHFYNGFDDPYHSPLIIHSGQYGNQNLEPNAADTAWTILKFTPPDTLTYTNNMYVKWQWQPYTMDKTINVAVSGRGILPPDPELSLSADSLFFGECLIGDTKVDSVQILNSGESPLTLNSTEISVKSAHFAIVEGNVSSPITLQSGEFHQLLVQFAPQSMGPLTASLSILSNAPSSPDLIHLEGTGLLRQLSFDSQNLAFGNLPLGESGLDTLRISNSGNVNVSLDSILIASGAEFFSISGGGFSDPLILEPGAEHFVTVSFTPLEAIQYAGEMQLFSNFEDSPNSFTLTGAGVVPELGISPENLDFGEIQVGGVKSDSLILTNSGEAPLLLNQVALSGDSDFSITAGLIDGELELIPGKSHTVTIDFLPSTAVIHSAYLIIEHSAESSPDSVLLTGEGVIGIAQLTADSLNFGEVFLDSVALDSIYISNSGNGDLTLYPVFLDDESASFAIYAGTFTDSLILLPDERHLFVLGFIPTIEGEKLAALIIPHNGENVADTVLLSGVGQRWLSLDGQIPQHFELGQNFPNPFNPVTQIPLALPQQSYIRLTLYSLTGQAVAILFDGEMPAGYHRFAFVPQTYQLANGVYFYRVSSVDFNDVKKMIYLK